MLTVTSKNKVPQKLLNTHILNSCFSKRSYETKEEAIRAAEEIAEYRNKKYDKKGRDHWKFTNIMKSYHCEYCNKYHLTTSGQKKWKNLNGTIDKIALRNTQKNKNFKVKKNLKK